MVIFALAGLASACGTGRSLSLRTVEKSFYNAKIPFTSDWQPTPPNPYLAERPAADNPTFGLPPRFARHVTGWAASINPRTYVSRRVYVFDGASSAAAFGRWFPRHCKGNECGVDTVRNLVYFGPMSAAVKSALTALRR